MKDVMADELADCLKKQNWKYIATEQVITAGMRYSFNKQKIFDFLEKKVEHFEKYLEEKNNNADRWLTYMSILSTIFAVFFVYSGFKINDNVEKYENILKQLEKHKKKWDQEHQLMQLLYKVTYWRMKSEYENALDLLDDILRKDFVEIDNDKKYIVYKEIADTHYQMWESSEKSKENSANYQNAITYLERAIKLKPDNEDNDIFLRELKNKYNEMDNLTTAE